MMDVLLVIDMQNGVCNDNDLKEKCIKKINQRIAVYRAKNKPIIFIQHNDESLKKGQFDWEIIPELTYENEDIYVQKYHANSFYQTDLQEILLSLKTSSIEICGAQTEYCVDTTVKMAHGLGYKLQMVSGSTLTFNNTFMSAQETVYFYENIWDARFLTII